MASLKSNLAVCLRGLPSQEYVASPGWSSSASSSLFYTAQVSARTREHTENAWTEVDRKQEESGTLTKDFSGLEVRIPPVGVNTGLTDHSESQRSGGLTAEKTRIQTLNECTSTGWQWLSRNHSHLQTCNLREDKYSTHTTVKAMWRGYFALEITADNKIQTFI